MRFQREVGEAAAGRAAPTPASPASSAAARTCPASSSSSGSTTPVNTAPAALRRRERLPRRQASSIEATAKTFRTWAATVYAAVALAEVAGGAEEAQRPALLRHAVKAVGCPTRQHARRVSASYIHPGVISPPSRTAAWRNCGRPRRDPPRRPAERRTSGAARDQVSAGQLVCCCQSSIWDFDDTGEQRGAVVGGMDPVAQHALAVGEHRPVADRRPAPALQHRLERWSRTAPTRRAWRPRRC